MNELRHVWVWDKHKEAKVEGYLLYTLLGHPYPYRILAPTEYDRWKKDGVLKRQVKQYKHIEDWTEPEPEIGSWCKFWDYGDEPSIANATVAKLLSINKHGYHPYKNHHDYFMHCKQLKGNLEELR